LPDNSAMVAAISLSPQTYALGLQELSARDPMLAEIRDRFGEPPMWERPQGFSTLVHIILEQQVSLASAKAAFNKLLDVASPLTPQRLLELDDPTLKAAGFSRQKTSYVRDLAHAIRDGRLELSRLETMNSEQVRVELMKIKGIGHWTADIYLLMCLLRVDIWPRGDLALAAAVQEVLGLESRPSYDELEIIALKWKPWRAVAARFFWHYYLSTPRVTSRVKR
jgi:DNA-3-methyladenine glycosylase II